MFYQYLQHHRQQEGHQKRAEEKSVYFVRRMGCSIPIGGLTHRENGTTAEGFPGSKRRDHRKRSQPKQSPRSRWRWCLAFPTMYRAIRTTAIAPGCWSASPTAGCASAVWCVGPARWPKGRPWPMADRVILLTCAAAHVRCRFASKPRPSSACPVTLVLTAVLSCSAVLWPIAPTCGNSNIVMNVQESLGAVVVA